MRAHTHTQAGRQTDRHTQTHTHIHTHATAINYIWFFITFGVSPLRWDGRSEKQHPGNLNKNLGLRSHLTNTYFHKLHQKDKTPLEEAFLMENFKIPTVSDRFRPFLTICNHFRLFSTGRCPEKTVAPSSLGGGGFLCEKSVWNLKRRTWLPAQAIIRHFYSRTPIWNEYIEQLKLFHVRLRVRSGGIPNSGKMLASPYPRNSAPPLLTNINNCYAINGYNSALLSIKNTPPSPLQWNGHGKPCWLWSWVELHTHTSKTSKKYIMS